jgi:electron transfer flavoprotein beta subunit
MKIVVCLKEVIETGIKLGYGQVDPALMQKGLTYRLNPLDAQALAEALRLKKLDSGVRVTLVSLGPESVESCLRYGLAAGADEAIRIWDEDLREITPFQTARVLTGAVKLLNADLILVGSKSLDNASGLVGPLMAAWLNIPCVCEVIDFQVEKDKPYLTITRNVSKGIQERALASSPALLSVAGSKEKVPYTSLENILASAETDIRHLSLLEIGISPQELQKDPTRITGVSFPRPRPRSVPYDSSLPAFYRILALLQGGISKRRGELLQGNTETLVNQLFELLVKEEVLKPAAK